MENILDLTWTQFKNFVKDPYRMRFKENDSFYYIYYTDGSGKIETSVLKDGGSDQTDFETNYKSSTNQPNTLTTNVNMIAPFGSKTIVVSGITKKLYSRYTGLKYELDEGENEVSYTATYAWSKLLGIEVVNCEALDTASLKIYDTDVGTYSGVPNALLNQFAFDLTLPKDYYIKMSNFDADIYAGLVIKIIYTSMSAKTVGLNLLLIEVKS